MSELTDRVRKMLSQAQVFARDTPFEAVARARQAQREVEAALATGVAPSANDERAALERLRQVVGERLARYEAQLAVWTEEVRSRAERYSENERQRLAQPLPGRD